MLIPHRAPKSQRSESLAFDHADFCVDDQSGVIQTDIYVINVTLDGALVICCDVFASRQIDLVKGITTDDQFTT